MWYFDVDKLLFLCKDGKERYLMVDERTLLIFVESLTDLPNVALPKVANVVFGVFDPTQKVSNSMTYTLYARGFLRIGGQELSFTSSQFVFHYRVGERCETYRPPVVTFLQDTI